MPANGQFELVFLRDASVYDGRFANNSWLQECPDPLTKLTWDNAAVMSPATAKTLNVSDESLVKLQVGGRSVEVAGLHHAGLGRRRGGPARWATVVWRRAAWAAWTNRPWRRLASMHTCCVPHKRCMPPRG